MINFQFYLLELSFLFFPSNPRLLVFKLESPPESDLHTRVCVCVLSVHKATFFAEVVESLTGCVYWRLTLTDAANGQTSQSTNTN